DHQAAADSCAGMDFDARPEAAPLGDASGEKAELMAVKPVGQTVVKGSMDAGIEQKDFQLAPGGRVSLLVRVQCFQQHKKRSFSIGFPLSGGTNKKTPAPSLWTERRSARFHSPVSLIGPVSRPKRRALPLPLPDAHSLRLPEGRLQPVAAPL